MGGGGRRRGWRLGGNKERGYGSNGGDQSNVKGHVWNVGGLAG